MFVISSFRIFLSSFLFLKVLAVSPRIPGISPFTSNLPTSHPYCHKTIINIQLYPRIYSPLTTSTLVSGSNPAQLGNTITALNNHLRQPNTGNHTGPASRSRRSRASSVWRGALVVVPGSRLQTRQRQHGETRSDAAR